MSRRAANALTTLRREDCAEPFDICPTQRQLSPATAVTCDISFNRNSCLPARSWISLISYNDGRLPRTSVDMLFILQTTGAPSSRHCPSQDHRGGLCLVFRGWLGRRRCRYRCGGVCGRRSGVKTESDTCYHLSGERDATCVLVYQDNANVLALNEPVESGLDGGIISLAVHYQEVLLRVWAGRHMLSKCQIQFPTMSFREAYTNASEEQTGY